MKREGNNRTHTLRSSVSAKIRLATRLAALLLFAPAIWSQQETEDLTNRSIEDLMKIQVVSVSKTEQTLSKTAAAVFVITREDIAYSGALNLPDVLRMVPGVDVAQINASAWAISIRGLNHRFSNEVLVLVDGRSVYTSSFGGVYWDTLDLPLEDIERIEVIRGPGSSVWGANAVNGVINIITEKASESHGVLAVAGGGNVNQGFGTLQYGGAAGSATDFRMYARYLNDGHFPGLTGQNGGDGWHSLRGGLRTDTAVGPRDELTVEGDLYSDREGTPTVALPSITSPGLVPIEILANVNGGFIQGVWKHTASAKSDTTLQVSYDHYQRNDALRDHRGTLDLDFQHHFLWGVRQSILWGLTFRDTDSYSEGSLYVSLVPAKLNTQLFGSFVQDEISVIPDQLSVTVGTKIEDNYYTGLGAMPSIRAAWTPEADQTLWAAISRSLRTPDAVDVGARSNLGSFVEPDGTLVLDSFIGNAHVQDETLIAYELGYRRTIRKDLSLDFAAHYYSYGSQETFEPIPSFFENNPAPPHLVRAVTYENLMHGEAHGFELNARWRLTPRWTLSPGYAFERIHMHLAPTSLDTSSVAEAEGASPVHSAQLRSHLVLVHGLAFDATAYFVDRLADPAEPAYTRFDTGLSWRLTDRGSVSVVGQNLVKDHHEEFVDFTESARTNLVKRSAYAKLQWEF